MVEAPPAHAQHDKTCAIIVRNMSPNPSRLLGVAAASLVMLAGTAVAGRQSNPVGLRVFTDADFRGPSATFVRDTPDLGPSGMALMISSLQVAAGELWEICTEPRFEGRCRTVSEDMSDLRRGNWNDAIVSVRRLRGGAVRGGGQGPGRAGVSGIHIFGDINYRGTSATLTSSVPDLDDQGMSRVVSSLRVDPGEVWQVCTEANYRGRCLNVSEDLSDLRRGEWNDVIVSARRLRGPAAMFGGGRLATGLEVFADINFRGRSNTFTTNTPDVSSRGMANVISSVRVAPGEVWEVCSQPNFRGRCEILAEDVSDLRPGEWNDAIASVRRVR
jgi:hypothetical protein